MDMHFYIIIPARYGSSRLPGKPLLDIAGKPMIQHVYERALEAGAMDVVVATDDERIHQAVNQFDGKAVMTSPDHETGTDRLAEVAIQLQWPDDAVVVNLQGDEPLVDAMLLKRVAENLHRHNAAGMTTLATPIGQRADIFNPNVVKVVCDQAGHALYFSRAPIPWVRGNYETAPGSNIRSKIQPLRHIGIYGYRVSVLKKVTQLPPSPPEEAESLEQLRALSNGIQIHVDCIEEAPGHGVDTPDDLERVRKLLLQ